MRCTGAAQNHAPESPRWPGTDISLTWLCPRAPLGSSQIPHAEQKGSEVRQGKVELLALASVCHRQPFHLTLTQFLPLQNGKDYVHVAGLNEMLGVQGYEESCPQ